MSAKLSDDAASLLAKIHSDLEDGMQPTLGADEVVAAAELITAGLVRAEDGLEWIALHLTTSGDGEKNG